MDLVKSDLCNNSVEWRMLLSVTAEETESEPECQRLSCSHCCLSWLESFFSIVSVCQPYGWVLLWGELYIHILKSRALQKIILFGKKKDCCRWDCLSWGPTGESGPQSNITGILIKEKIWTRIQDMWTSSQTIRVTFCSLQEWVCWCLALLLFASRTNGHFLLLGHSVFHTFWQQP